MKFTLSNGKEIYYEIHGEGKPLVMLNGIMMSTASWKEFVQPLSENTRLILVDFLDQGQSDKIDGPYTHAIQISALDEFIKGCVNEPFDLFGISYGGEIALQYALLYPEQLEKLLLFNTCMHTSYWLQEVGNAWNKASADPEMYYFSTIPYIYSPLFFSKNRQWMETRKEVLLEVFSDQSFIESMKRLTDSSINYDIRKEAHNLKIPTLIVGSEYDFVTPFFQQKEMNKVIENSELVCVPNSGHAIMYEKPSLFTALVKGFVSSHKGNYTL